MRDGVVMSEAAVGHALRYADGHGTPLPEAEQVGMRADTIFDLASLTKLFTTTVLLSLVDAGCLELDAPIHPYLPTFASGIRRSVSLRHLLTHTSGLAGAAEPVDRLAGCRGEEGGHPRMRRSSVRPGPPSPTRTSASSWPASSLRRSPGGPWPSWSIERVCRRWA